MTVYIKLLIRIYRTGTQRCGFLLLDEELVAVSRQSFVLSSCDDTGLLIMYYVIHSLEPKATTTMYYALSPWLYIFLISVDI